jgi:integrase
MSTVVALRAKTGKRPNTENRKVARTRNYLTPDEVDRLMAAAARAGRYGHRDATLMLLAYRHGLRVSELVGPAGRPQDNGRALGLARWRNRRAGRRWRAGL